MNDLFDLPVNYKGKEMMLKTSLLVTGYTHKFNVEIGGKEYIFEPDEERNYRAIIPYDELGNQKDVDGGLLKAIAGAIESLVK